MGPKRDLVGEVEKAVRERGLKFGVSNHTAWNYMFFQWNHINDYDARKRNIEDLHGNPIVPQGMKILTVKPVEQKNKVRWGWFKRARTSIRPSQRDVDRWVQRTKKLRDRYNRSYVISIGGTAKSSLNPVADSLARTTTIKPLSGVKELLANPMLSSITNQSVTNPAPPCVISNVAAWIRYPIWCGRLTTVFTTITRVYYLRHFSIGPAKLR